MPRTISHEALVSFVDEVRSYLPTMRQGIAGYHTDASQTDALREAYRLAHSVKGTAALVNLPGLAHVMSMQEDLLEAVCEARHVWDNATHDFATGVLNLVESYCDDLLLKRADEAAFIAAAAKLQAQLAGLDEAGDEASIAEFVVTTTSAETVEPLRQAQGLAEQELHEDAFDPSSLVLNDQEQLDAFQLEAEDHLHDFATALAEYRRSPESLDVLRQARRTIHSLKGSASTIGLNEVAHLAHQMEDVLQQLLDGHLPQQDSTIDLLQESTDRLEELIAGAALNENIAHPASVVAPLSP